MVYIVSPTEKKMHFVLHKTRLRKVLFANRFIARTLRVFWGWFFKLIFGLNLINDDVNHPFYFTPNDVMHLFDQCFDPIKIKIFPSEWNYKKELFVVAQKTLSLL